MSMTAISGSMIWSNLTRARNTHFNFPTQLGLNEICSGKYGSRFAYARQIPAEQVFVCHIADATWPNGDLRTDFLRELQDQGSSVLSEFVVLESDLESYFESEAHCSTLTFNEFYHSKKVEVYY